MKIENVIDDVYSILENSHKVSQDNLNDLLTGVSTVLTSALDETVELN